jgi:hypothetical protein
VTVEELYNAVEALLPRYRDKPVLAGSTVEPGVHILVTPSELRPDEDRVLLAMEPFS